MKLPINDRSMNGKPVLYRKNSRTVLTLKSPEFQEKKLCDGITMNCGDACCYSCTFCYVGPSMIKVDKPVLEEFNRAEGNGCPKQFQDVVIRRPNAAGLLQSQLFTRNGVPRFTDPGDNRVVYSSTLVDVAANMELLRETAEACNLILDNTAWQIRLLSKSNLLHLLFKNELIPAQHRHRMILGFSTGTLDDRVAKAIEIGTPLVSKRLASLHWLQDEGYRTFGMICPSLPQTDYDRFSQEICDAIRVDCCEHVWAEVINVRGKSLTRTQTALVSAGLLNEAEQLAEVCGSGKSENWENYARATFEAHARNVVPEKLRFLQYVKPQTQNWWSHRESRGAVLLGKAAK
jgi:DNA repair photolyase